MNIFHENSANVSLDELALLVPELLNAPQSKVSVADGVSTRCRASGAPFFDGTREGGLITDKLATNEKH